MPDRERLALEGVIGGDLLRLLELRVEERVTPFTEWLFEAGT